MLSLILLMDGWGKEGLLQEVLGGGDMLGGGDIGIGEEGISKQGLDKEGLDEGLSEQEMLEEGTGGYIGGWEYRKRGYAWGKGYRSRVVGDIGVWAEGGGGTGGGNVGAGDVGRGDWLSRRRMW